MYLKERQKLRLVQESRQKLVQLWQPALAAESVSDLDLRKYLTMTQVTGKPIPRLTEMITILRGVPGNVSRGILNWAREPSFLSIPNAACMYCQCLNMGDLP